MKINLSYQVLFTIAIVGVVLNFMVNLGVVGLVIKVVTVVALLWGIVEFVRHQKIIKIKVTKN